MKFALVLYTENDSSKARELKDHLQGRLRSIAKLRNIKDVLVQKQKLKDKLPRSDCVVLIVSSQASSLIQNKRTEIEDGFETFDGKLFYKEFTENKDLLERLIIVFVGERTKNDWIPADFDEKRIFDLVGEKIREGNPILDHLLYRMKQILLKDE